MQADQGYHLLLIGSDKRAPCMESRSSNGAFDPLLEQLPLPRREGIVGERRVAHQNLAAAPVGHHKEHIAVAEPVILEGLITKVYQSYDRSVI